MNVFDPHQSLGKFPPSSQTSCLEMMTPGELCDHLEKTNDAGLRFELAHLDGLTRVLAARRGAEDPRFLTIRKMFETFRENLVSHLREERNVLFPLIRLLESSPSRSGTPYLSLKAPAALMQRQHNDADEALAEMHDLAADDSIAGSAPTLLDAIVSLENSVHEQIYAENQILFPRALSLAG